MMKDGIVKVTVGAVYSLHHVMDSKKVIFIVKELQDKSLYISSVAAEIRLVNRRASLVKRLRKDFISLPSLACF